MGQCVASPQGDTGEAHLFVIAFEHLLRDLRPTQISMLIHQAHQLFVLSCRPDTALERMIRRPREWDGRGQR
eukprot:scaffold25864_cov140-Isochrysis_galbana.AAC.2